MKPSYLLPSWWRRLGLFGALRQSAGPVLMVPFARIAAVLLFVGVLLAGCVGGTCAPAADAEGGCGYPQRPRPTAVRDFDSCVASGGVVESSTPLQICRTIDGMIFSQFFSR